VSGSSKPRAILGCPSGDLTSAEAGAARVVLRLGRNGPHDAVEIVAWPGSRLADLAADDPLTVSLGPGDDETLAFTGTVTDVRQGPDALAVEALGATMALSRTRKVQSYLNQTVADIVRDLASDVETDRVEADLSLASYAVDDRRPLWTHLLDLAALAGADVTSTAEGKLVFAPPRTGAADVRLRHGADIVTWRVGASAPLAAAAPAVAAHGAGSEQGSEKWHWILRAPSPAGDGPPTRIVAALATRDAAEKAQKALADRAGRAAVQGFVVAVGQADLRPGALVDLADLPAGDPGTLRVLAVEHRLDREGFRSRLRVESASPTGAAGAGGLP
jgi:hypothetical protein